MPTAHSVDGDKGVMNGEAGETKVLLEDLFHLDSLELNYKDLENDPSYDKNHE